MTPLLLKVCTNLFYPTIASFTAMPARRRRFRRRRPRRFRRRRRTMRRRRLVLDPERKFTDTPESSVVFITQPFIQHLSMTTVGVGDTDRLGKQVLFTSWQATFTVDSITDTTFPRSIRWLLVRDSSPDVAILTVGDLLVDPNLPIESPLNLDQTRRFRVLLQGRFTLSANTAFQRTVTRFKRMRMITRYQGGNQAPNRNQLVFFMFADGADVGEGVNLDIFFRERFVG